VDKFYGTSLTGQGCAVNERGKLLVYRADTYSEGAASQASQSLGAWLYSRPMQAKEWSGLRKIIQRLRKQTRWQVYVRVLPVVFFAVILVGTFGTIAFTGYEAAQLVSNERNESTYLLETLRQKAIIETLSLEARRSDFVLGAALPTEVSACEEWSTEMLRMDYLVGVALIGNISEAGGRQAQFMSFVDSLSGPVNDSRLQTWFANHSQDFQGGFATEHSPVLSYESQWHPTYIFPPVLIEEVRGRSQASAGGELAALLPVMVSAPAGDGEDSSSLEVVYFLSLNRMLTDILRDSEMVVASKTWWSVVDGDGRVIDTADGVLTVGSLLENQHRVNGEGPFAVASGSDIVGHWQLGRYWGESLFGSGLNQWVVTAGQSPEFPMAILVGHEASGLRTTTLRYIAATLGVALLALALAIVGVTRVVGGISTRLKNLSHNMEEVAKGDYTRRIPSTKDDEVGRLITYFNQMASSLTETQKELRKKTIHLEAALENRRNLDRGKDDFLVLISHEVRTPLTAIMGGVNILKSMVGRTTGVEHDLLEKMNVVEVVEIIESSGERLHSFMNDAIQMTSIQSSDKQLALCPTAVNSLVEMGLCGVREVAQMRGIEVVNALADEDAWQVLCDERVMKLAFEKILKNAVEHNYGNGRVVIREVDGVQGAGHVSELARAEDNHRLMSQESFMAYSNLGITWRIIEVFNTGDAIPAERREALFGKFEIVGRIEHHQRGSGLSLPIAQSAVQNHGGRIFVHSAKLQGNSFFIMLPTVNTADLSPQQLSRSTRSRLTRTV
jgi:signal transduction histidine kinase